MLDCWCRDGRWSSLARKKRRRNDDASVSSRKDERRQARSGTLSRRLWCMVQYDIVSLVWRWRFENNSKEVVRQEDINYIEQYESPHPMYSWSAYKSVKTRDASLTICGVMDRSRLWSFGRDWRKNRSRFSCVARRGIRG